MSSLIFKCSSCDDFHEMDRDVPTGFSGWSYPEMLWTDFTDKVPPLSKDLVLRNLHSDVTPKVGQTRTLRVWLPFEETIGNEFYMDYSPKSVHLNWYKSANDLARSAIVKCKFTEILESNDFQAWIKVLVLDVKMFPDLVNTFEPYKTGKALEAFASMECDHVDLFEKAWKLISWSAQDDVTERKAIFTDRRGVRHLVWMSHDDFTERVSYFGNIIQG